VLDAATQQVLQECVRRESRSLLQYVREVPLWVGPADRPVLAKLQALARAEETETDALGRYLQKGKAGLTSLGPYPSSFTTVNDAALHYLLPRLAAEQRTLIGRLDADLTRIAEPAAHAHLAELLRLKRQHLTELESLSTGPSTVWK
jgi:hypothetical protein